MADVIRFADFTQLAEMIDAANVQVSGMSAAEAAAALNATETSGLYIYNAAQAASGASNIIDFPNASNAAEAFNEFLAAEGSVSDIGAAVGATGSAKAVANMAVGQSLVGQAATAVYGVMSVSLPTAAAALAPLAGFSIGVGLYESNPEFWEKISRTLLPFCYTDSQSVPVMVDQNGQTYFDQRLIDALKQLAEDEGVGGGPTIIDSPLPLPSGISFPLPVSDNYAEAAVPSWNTFYLRPVDDWFRCCSIWSGSGSNSTILAVSYSPFYTQFGYIDTNGGDHPGSISRFAASYTYDNRTVYYGSNSSFPAKPTTPPPANPTGAPLPVSGQLAWTILYGDYTAGGYPDGTQEWEGDPYPAQPQPINVYGGLDQAQQPIFYPYYPVALPVGDPWATSDPSVNPDPVTNPDPKPVIDPWLNPEVRPDQYPPNWPYPLPDNPPVPNPVPAPQNVPSPSTDPSQDPDPDDIPDNPGDPEDPKDRGDSDTPVIPVIPTLPSAASGLLHVYNPTQGQIDAFGAWLWSTFSGSLIDILSKLFNDPMDAVIGLHELYATPDTQGSATIRAGFLDSEIPAQLVGSRYTTINCGTVIVEEYWQNYLDYEPYTQAFIYLPFIGIVKVDANDIVGNAVNIKYNVDSYTGCCIATITVARSNYQSTVYQFEGNCAVEIPITSGYQAALMSGLLTVASTAISGSPIGGMLMSGRAGGSNQVQHSGSFGSSYGAMGAKIPYIIIKRPTQKVVYNYSLSYGYPAHKMVFVGNCTGYVRALEVIATSSKATENEIDLIITLLKSGVYVH